MRINIYLIIFQGPVNVILKEQVAGVVSFEFCYELKDLFIAALKYKMNVIWHKDESQDFNSCKGRYYWYYIHSGFEVLLVPEQDRTL